MITSKNSIHGYSYDVIADQLNVTESFLKRASVLNSPEYDIIRQFRNEHPGRPIVHMPKKDSGKRPMKLSFKQMGEFIAKCRDAEARLARFEQVKVLSRVQPSPYAYVKTWFLENYANYSEQPEFDADNFVIVKTRSEMAAAAENKAEKTANEDQAEEATA